MFGKTIVNGWKKVAVFGGALAALAVVAAVPANALPNLAGRSMSVNTSMHHDKTAGIDYTNTLKIISQDPMGNLVGTMVDKYNVIWNVSGKVAPGGSWDNYTFTWQAGALGKAMQFTGVLNAPVPATQYHKPVLFATGTYLRQNYSNGQWYTFGPAPISMTADEYYSYTYPSSPIIIANPGPIVVSP